MSLLLSVYIYISLIVRFAKEFSTINKCINVFKHIHCMKKMRSFFVAILLLCAAMPGYSQFSITSWEEHEFKWFQHGTRDPGDDEDDPTNPTPEEPSAPLGSGVVVLTALGGAYLIGKKRRQEWRRSLTTFAWSFQVTPHTFLACWTDENVFFLSS